MDSNVDYSLPIKLKDENSFVDWGAVESPIGEKISQTSGFLISKNKTQILDKKKVEHVMEYDDTLCLYNIVLLFHNTLLKFYNLLSLSYNTSRN